MGAAPMPSKRREVYLECMKLFVFAGVIIAIVVCSKEVGSAVLSSRKFFKDRVPLGLCLSLVVLVNGVRRIFPPLYYTLPTGTLAILILVDKLGVWMGGLAYQATNLFDLVWFFALRWLYEKPMFRILDEDAPPPTWLPRTGVGALRLLDGAWTKRIAPSDEVPSHHRAAAVVLLGAAWATDIELTIVFITARCRLRWRFFALSWVGVLILHLPEVLVRAHIARSAAAALQKSSFAAVRHGLEKLPPWLAALWLCIVVTATLLVHRVHFQLVAATLEGESAPRMASAPRSVEEPRSVEAIAEDAKRRRDEQRRTIVATQRLELTATRLEPAARTAAA
ncbi:hypothetical protein M885DRAFT_524847 [Pelagophyceae sp. CCMP2097]|nr:hypothetical protein M885DRAFT_524847 [Pelagophyceae sp. CCMP2097]